MVFRYDYRSARRGRPVGLILLVLIAVIIALVTLSQMVQLILNFWEFGDLFVRPFYYSLIGGLMLSAIAFFRVDFRSRRSFTLWLISLILKFYRRAGYLELQNL
ncbi:MAG: hypothetical protein QXG25_06815, partial [Nitrososphaerota archaeon]